MQAIVDRVDHLMVSASQSWRRNGVRGDRKGSLHRIRFPQPDLGPVNFRTAPNPRAIRKEHMYDTATTRPSGAPSRSPSSEALTARQFAIKSVKNLVGHRSRGRAKFLERSGCLTWDTGLYVRRMVRIRRCRSRAHSHPTVDNGYERQFTYVYGA